MKQIIDTRFFIFIFFIGDLTDVLLHIYALAHRAAYLGNPG